MFIDLRQKVKTMKDSDPACCGVTAIMGLPVQKMEGGLFYGSTSCRQEYVQRDLVEALGHGAILTYGNPKGKSYKELGELCLYLGHTWTYNVTMLTLGFFKVPISVRNAFAFDGRYHLSWAEREEATKVVSFTATASLREWRKLGTRRYDESWKKDQRHWFNEAYDILHELFPHFFLDEEQKHE